MYVYIYICMHVHKFTYVYVHASTRLQIQTTSNNKTKGHSFLHLKVPGDPSFQAPHLAAILVNNCLHLVTYNPSSVLCWKIWPMFIQVIPNMFSIKFRFVTYTYNPLFLEHRLTQWRVNCTISEQMLFLAPLGNANFTLKRAIWGQTRPFSRGNHATHPLFLLKYDC